MTSPNFPIAKTEEEFYTLNPKNSFWTEILIEAPPDVVQAVCVDFETRPSWDPFLTRMKVTGDVGDLSTNPKLYETVDPYMNGQAFRTPFAMPFSKNDEEGLIWGANLVGGCMFRADHGHLFIPVDGGETTKFANYECQSGFFKYLKDFAAYKKAFEATNEALKRVCEDGNEYFNDV